jgi:hypothetical protein
MKFAPIGAFGAMAFTIGKFGLASLLPLMKLMGSFYLTCGLFVFVVLGTIAKFTGFSIFRFISYIKEELLIVLGTSSSESALPALMRKLEKLGCSKSVVGLVVPTGYSFNLDGTNIYMTMAALFVAQATNTELTLMQELTILGVAMLTSKGASGITGAGFITLAATLAVVPTIPVAGMALILGIDRFMSECRALTNFIGNGVATVVVSKWEKELDQPLRQVLHLDMDAAAQVVVDHAVRAALALTDLLAHIADFKRVRRQAQALGQGPQLRDTRFDQLARRFRVGVHCEDLKIDFADVRHHIGEADAIGVDEGVVRQIGCAGQQGGGGKNGDTGDFFKHVSSGGGQM